MEESNAKSPNPHSSSEREPHEEENLVDPKFLVVMKEERQRLEKQRRFWDKDDIEASLRKMGQTALEMSKPEASAFSKAKMSGLKKLVREGIPADLRGKIWPLVFDIESLGLYNYDFDVAMRRAFGKTKPSSSQTPHFGGRMHYSLPLTPRGFRVAEFILGILAFENPVMEAAPILPTLTSILLLYCPPTQTLGILNQIVKNGNTPKMWVYLPMALRDSILFTYIFVDLVKLRLPKLHRFITSLHGSTQRWNALWEDVFNSLYLDFLPLPAVLRVIDSFLFEGFKILFRIGLGVLKTIEKSVYSCETMGAVITLIKNEMLNAHGERFDEFFKAGFSIQVDRAGLETLKFRNISHVAGDLVSHKLMKVPEKPELDVESKIVTDDDLVYLWRHVPSRMRINNLELKYSFQTKGHSLSNLIENVDVAPTVMFIQTMGNERFGAYLTHTWQTRQNRTFFGNGECFIFKLDGDTRKTYHWARLASRSSDDLSDKVSLTSSLEERSSSSVPDYFMMKDQTNFIVIGGGDGFALWIDTNLRFGKSERCQTFENEPLSGQERFEILFLEVYAFV